MSLITMRLTVNYMVNTQLSVAKEEFSSSMDSITYGEILLSCLALTSYVQGCRGKRNIFLGLLRRNQISIECFDYMDHD
jgi:hypothetical protein